MSCTVKELSFASSNGFSTVKAWVYLPEGEPIAYLQVAHGMAENLIRYDDFMRFIADNGVLCFGNDHIGHGDSVASKDDQGFFADKNGEDCLIEDLDRLYELVKQEYGDKPRFLLGHSMGSFIVRYYEDKHADKLAGLLISGTGGPNPMVGVGIFLSKLIGSMKGRRYRSKFIDNLAMGNNNKGFEYRTGSEWLTSDTEIVDKFLADEKCRFKFTVSAFETLFQLVKKTNDKGWFIRYRKDLSTYIFSGDHDPVGNYGKGPDFVNSHLVANGVKSVTYKLYKGGRHEMLNELCRKDVYNDLLGWLTAQLAVR